MNNKITCIISFAIGAAVGSIISWQFLEQKYKAIADDEINSVKEKFRSMSGETIKENVEESQKKAYEATHKPDIKEYIKEYSDMVKKEKYVNYSDYDQDKEDVSHQMKKVSKIEVISPGEFGEDEGYEKVVLNYYSDGVLADSESNEVVDNVGYIVGDDFDSHFGEYEDDCVFLRNDTEETYYEILRDNRSYEEVCGDKPKPVEVQ